MLVTGLCLEQTAAQHPCLTVCMYNVYVCMCVCVCVLVGIFIYTYMLFNTPNSINMAPRLENPLGISLTHCITATGTCNT